jgi:DNA-binding XRE family transcriptional regulator
MTNHYGWHPYFKLGTKNKMNKPKEGNVLDIGHRIKVARIDARLLQKELAEKLGMKACTISLWESNERRISAQTLGEIAYFLGKPISYFYYEK